MIQEIAYTIIFGKPLIAYMGVLTISLLFFTASIAIMNRRGITLIPFKWHPRMAIVTIISAIIHGILGLSISLGF